MNVAPQHAAVGSPVNKELQDFLKSMATSIKSLSDYPTVARASVKANSTLPSSAAVEHLFSIAGIVLSPRCCKMFDKLFDRVAF